jgi:hypothetical protein
MGKVSENKDKYFVCALLLLFLKKRIQCPYLATHSAVKETLDYN